MDPSGGGHLTGLVLMPAHPGIQAIGGPGREFWVDGKNYDESSTLNQAIAKKGQPTEAGSWRIELSPASSSKEDEFLVVLIPRGAGNGALPGIRRLGGDEAYGVEIRSGEFTGKWWFATNRQGVRLEDGAQSVLIPGKDAAAPEAPTLWGRLRAWWQAR